MTINIEALKKQAASEAVKFIKKGMVVGLGTGTTATYAIDILAEEVAKGLDILAIPTSEKAHQQAKNGGIPVTSFAKHPIIDITIDGADQVEKGSLNLIKGLGGALLREKIVASASKKLLIIIDQRKFVNKLGGQSPIPVEIVPFGWEVTRSKVEKLCSNANLRFGTDGNPVITDGGNYILDCQVNEIGDAVCLAKDLKLLTGVVETGLFINMADVVIVAQETGTSLFKRR